MKALKSALRRVDDGLLDHVFQPTVDRFGPDSGRKYWFAQWVVDIGAGICIAVALEVLLRSSNPARSGPIVGFQLFVDLIALAGSRRYVAATRRLDILRRHIANGSRDRDFYRGARAKSAVTCLMCSVMAVPLLLVITIASDLPMVAAAMILPFVSLLAAYFLSCDDAPRRKYFVEIKSSLHQEA